MRHVLIALVAMLCGSIAIAQETENRYYDEQLLLCSKDKAKYIFTFTEKGNKWYVEEHNLAGALLMTGYVNSLDKSFALARDGRFVYYSASGHKVKEGVYTSGVYDGKWLFYYSGTDTLEREIAYRGGAKLYSRTFDRTNGWLRSETIYRAGNDDSTTFYGRYDNGQLKRVSIYKGDKAFTEHCFTMAGKDTTCSEEKGGKIYTFVERMPSPPYNMNAYLSLNTVYPKAARKANIQGRVAVRFVVNEDGSISDVMVEDGVSPELDEEAVRVVSTMPRWRSGTQNGKPVKVQYTQPITFKLSD